MIFPNIKKYYPTIRKPDTQNGFIFDTWEDYKKYTNRWRRGIYVRKLLIANQRRLLDLKNKEIKQLRLSLFEK